VRLALSTAIHDKLRRAQALLSHAVPSGDVAAVVERALDALIVQLERRKHAATGRPSRGAAQARARTGQTSEGPLAPGQVESSGP